MQGTTIFVVGNLTNDPEFKFLPSGVGVCNFNLAVNNRTRKGDEWVDGEPTFYRVAVWRDYGEHVATSLKKGDQAFVAGKLITRTWENNDGEQRSSLDITADEVAATMRWATLTVTKASRGQAQDQGPAKGGQFTDEPPF